MMDKIIYHIATKANWDDAIESGIYLCESLETEGFIHCSKQDQVLDVANSRFSGRMDLLLLSIYVPDLQAQVKYEAAVDTQLSYPHVYGPLNLEAVTRANPFEPDRSSSFSMPPAVTQIHFWETTPLPELTRQQWEALCDGCARCCLYKIEDIDTNELFFTNVACRFLDEGTCRCTDYPHRHEIMPTCIILTPDSLEEIDWMPKTCAYRLLKEKHPLPWWHPLVSGTPDTVKLSGYSIFKRYVNEKDADMENLQDYIFDWFDILIDET